jgi:hypothetical protein
MTVRHGASPPTDGSPSPSEDQPSTVAGETSSGLLGRSNGNPVGSDTTPAVAVADSGEAATGDGAVPGQGSRDSGNEPLKSAVSDVIADSRVVDRLSHELERRRRIERERRGGR